MIPAQVFFQRSKNSAIGRFFINYATIFCLPSFDRKRRKGRPTRRWTEDIKKWLPMSPTEAGREAQKKEVLRQMVREATSTQTCQDE